jgi:dUTP pyrophosphatase
MIDATSTLHVEVKILDPRIHEWGLPRRHSAMAAAIDLFACIDAPLAIDPDSAAHLIPAGIAIHIGKPGYAALIVPRSGLGHRAGLVMGNLVGVLDADYMGPVMISAWNRNPPGTTPILIQPGDRIAQMLFVPVARPNFTVVDAFSQQSARGEAGFGSTG